MLPPSFQVCFSVVKSSYIHPSHRFPPSVSLPTNVVGYQTLLFLVLKNGNHGSTSLASKNPISADMNGNNSSNGVNGNPDEDVSLF
jgi:hypothetical protein